MDPQNEKSTVTVRETRIDQCARRLACSWGLSRAVRMGKDHFLAVTHRAGDDSIFERCRNCRFTCQWRMTRYTQGRATIFQF
jgi:hypothetical protein